MRFSLETKWIESFDKSEFEYAEFCKQSKFLNDGDWKSEE
jgi:hypothetical protein